MIFQKESIEAILDGRKTMTRRIVKEGELEFQEPCRVETFLGRVKWRVGKKYAVCPGRGKPQIWYCPKCKRLLDMNWYKTGFDNIECNNATCFKKGIYITHFVPLFIELVSIRKEKLLDITEEDAKKEGFESKGHFLLKFCEINKMEYEWISSPELVAKATGLSRFEKDLLCLPEVPSFKVNKNPDVWVLNFKRVD